MLREGEAVQKTEIDVVVDKETPTKETELVLHDEETRTPMVAINVGEQFCLKGVWFQVTEVAEGQLTMQARGYTGRKLKELAQKVRERREAKNKRGL